MGALCVRSGHKPPVLKRSYVFGACEHLMLEKTHRKALAYTPLDQLNRHKSNDCMQLSLCYTQYNVHICSSWDNESRLGGCCHFWVISAITMQPSRSAKNESQP